MLFGLSLREHQIEKVNFYLSPLFKLAKERKIKLEFIKEAGIMESLLFYTTYWDSLKKDRTIFILIDKQNRIIPVDRPKDCLLLFAYNIARLDNVEKRLKPGVCRPVRPSFCDSKPQDKESIIFEKIQWEQGWACLAEEIEAWKDGMKILAEMKLLDASNATEITQAIQLMFHYLFKIKSSFTICRSLSEKDSCPVLDESLGLRPELKRDKLDLANKFYDIISGREGSWKELP